MSRIRKQFPKLIVRQRIVRLQFDRSAESSLGLVEAAVAKLRRSQMQLITCILRLNGDSAPKVNLGFTVFPLVDQRDGVQEQALRGIRAALKRVVKGAPGLLVTPFEIVTNRNAVMRFRPSRRSLSSPS